MERLTVYLVNLATYFIPITLLLCGSLTGCSSMAKDPNAPRHVAVLLPQSGRYASAANNIRQGVMNGYFSHSSRLRDKQHITFYDTAKAPSVPELYQKAIAAGADVVIGPLAKQNVLQLSLAPTFPVPTIALNYTDRQMYQLPQNFYEFGLMPEDETNQLVNAARSAGATNALIITPKNAWGERIADALQTRWVRMGGHIHLVWRYPSKLESQGMSQLLLPDGSGNSANVIFLIAKPPLAQQILATLKEKNTQIPIYATTSVKQNTAEGSTTIFQGLIICDSPSTSSPLYAVGQDAYLLSQKIKQLVANPNTTLDGNTGKLMLTPQHQIRRQLNCHPIS